MSRCPRCLAKVEPTRNGHCPECDAAVADVAWLPVKPPLTRRAPCPDCVAPLAFGERGRSILVFLVIVRAIKKKRDRRRQRDVPAGTAPPEPAVAN